MSRFYREFEDRFRGGREIIRARLEQYIPFLELLRDTVHKPKSVDLGCGRGEWLDLVDRLGFDAVGVDLDEEMLSEPRETGRTVFLVDAIEYLRTLDPGSVSLITAFHLAEHLPFDTVQKLISESFRALTPGGLLILETPNPENLVVGATTFHIDPTHNRPLVPQLLQFAVEFEGFSPTVVVRMQDDPAVRRRPTTLRDVLLGVSPDYAVVGRKSTGVEGEEVPEIFTRQWGVDLSELIDRFEGQLKNSASERAEARTSILADIDEVRSEVAACQADLAYLQGQFLGGQSKLDQALNEALAIERAEARTSILADIDDVRSEVAACQADLAYLQGQFLDGQSKLDQALNEAHAMRSSASWRLSKPLRALKRYTRTAVYGACAWLAFKPQSRPERIARRSIVSVHGAIQRHPALYRLARRTLDRVPGLERHVRQLVIPQHLSAAIFPAPCSNDTLIEPECVRLAYERLEFSKTLSPSNANSAAAVTESMPRLAYLSPLPPERSGIADYSAQVIPELSKFYDITLITSAGETSDEWLAQNCSVRSVEWFRDHAHEFDRVMYHFGNSLFHSHMLPLLRSIPGVVVLHDFFLSNMIAYLELYGGWGSVWTKSLMDSHGYDAVRLRMTEATMRSAIDTYPANFDVLAKATGLIVHSKHPLELSKKFYPEFCSDAWEVVPLPRIVPGDFNRHEARAALGLADDELLVCSFGFLGPNKLSHRLLAAWLGSALAQNEKCRLVYVGATHADQYCSDLSEKITAFGNGRVTVSGFVSSEIYHRYLQAADVGVQLRTNSRGETSAAVLDCMSYGLPTIANANGSMAELPGDSLILLPDDFSDASLSDALVELYQNLPSRGRIGARAAMHVARSHTVAYAAERYHAALEKFYSGSDILFDHKKLIEHSARLPEGDVRASINAARDLAGDSTKCGRPSKQILVDVSALKHHDLRTGIQRVVRAVLLELSKELPLGYRLEPVWMNKDQGEWRYHYARGFMLDFLGISPVDVGDDVVDVGKGDVFLALDFFAHGVIGASGANVYSRYRQRGAEIVFVVYDILPITMPHNFPPVSETVHRLWLDAVVDVADKLICISQSVADDVTAWLRQTAHPRAGEVDVVAWPLGADIGASSPTKGIPENGMLLLDRIRDGRSFLAVGTIEPRKGHMLILEAFERRWLEGSQDLLVLIGAEGWKGVARAERRSMPTVVNKLREHPELGKRLIWLETASDEFLQKIYSSADALIAASEGEGFGLPLIEAAQHKLPIIARDIPVFREVAGDHAFYFSSTTGADLAQALGEWESLHARGVHPKSDDMPWLTWAQSTEKLLSMVLPARDC